MKFIIIWIFFWLQFSVQLTGSVLVDINTVQYTSQKYYIEDIRLWILFICFKNVDLKMDIFKWTVDKGMIKRCTYIKWNIIHKKEWNNAIFSIMNEPRDCHTEWRRSGRERQMSYDIVYVWNLKNVLQMNLFTKWK